MKRSYWLSAITVSVLSLSGCQWGSDSPYASHPYAYGDNYYNPHTNGQLNDTFQGGTGRRPYYGTPQVPETYHLGGKRSPDNFKSVDSNWVNSQNPNGYTIELSNSDKPAEVARQLTETPKLERTAQVKYEKDGKTYYRGVYGTYPTKEAAEAALKKLPENIRSKADVNQWNKVQSGPTQSE
jgi:hypothetical protein